MDSLVILDPENEFCLNNEKIYFLENLSKINLFIGANNSRKKPLFKKDHRK